MSTETLERPVVGYSLSSEEHRPRDLVRYAARAEEVGFGYAMISDHFHPWLDAQGSSPFVWGVLGGIAEATSTWPVGTSVTCPTVRYHPALVAQAAATAAELLDGRFTLGVGTGEYLNEHIYGDPWPSHRIRCEMLEEAVAIIRRLWEGDWVEHHGPHFTVVNARLYTLPAEPPPVVSPRAGRGQRAWPARSATASSTTPPIRTSSPASRRRAARASRRTCSSTSAGRRTRLRRGARRTGSARTWGYRASSGTSCRIRSTTSRRSPS